MPVYQSFNPRIKAWVKYHFTKEGIEFTDVKQKKPKFHLKESLKKE